MKRVLLLSFFSVIFFTGCVANRDSSLSVNQEKTDLDSDPVNQDQTKKFTARFEIYTNGTKRIFTDKKYHNQSKVVFIENADPHLIIVEGSDITWNDFFQTLPMTLTSSCLVTGTKQTFCSNESRKLRFWINGVEVPNALESEIKSGDFLKVEY